MVGCLSNLSLLRVEPSRWGFAAASDDGRQKAGLKLVIDQGREAMKIERAVANSKVAEFSLLLEVHKEKRIKDKN